MENRNVKEIENSNERHGRPSRSKFFIIDLESAVMTISLSFPARNALNTNLAGILFFRLFLRRIIVVTSNQFFSHSYSTAKEHNDNNKNCERETEREERERERERERKKKKEKERSRSEPLIQGEEPHQKSIIQP